MDPYLIGLVILGALFFCFGVAGLRAAVNNGRLPNLASGARVIFTEEEPEGIVQDQFPAKAQPAAPSRA